MKTRTLHWIGIAISTLCLIGLVLAALDYRAARTLNAAVAAPAAVMQPDEAPRITLARGLAQARAGDTAVAQRSLQNALQRGDAAVQHQARYALGNLALRQAMAMGSSDEKLPAMLELAKQQYRDTLLHDPEFWPARYNLERALWLAPDDGIAQPGQEATTSREQTNAKTNDENTGERERAATTMKSEGGSLP